MADRTAERHRLFRGLSELLGALGPAVLVVEDLHWADEQTVEFVTYLLSGPPTGLSVVLTYRCDEAPAAVRAVATRPADMVVREHIALPPLDPSQTGAMAEAILDHDGVSAPFAAHLCERSSGLPPAIQELLALLRARGEVIRWRGGWARRTLDELDVPAGVRDSVQERVVRLAEGARAVAEAAAVLNIPTPLPVLADVSGLPRTDADGRRLPAWETPEQAFDVHYTCTGFARQCVAHAEALTPIVDRYDDRRQPEPDRLHPAGLVAARSGPIGLLRDLQDLYQLASLVDITWTLVGQAAAGARDRALLDVTARCRPQIATQLSWLRMRMKAAAPQTLLVAP